MERCQSELFPGSQCNLEDGHDGPHEIDGAIPREIGQLVEGMISSHESAAEEHQKAIRLHHRAARRLNFATMLTLIFAGANLGSLIDRLIH